MQQRAPTADQLPSFLAKWTSRLALFLVVLLVVTAFLHRVFGLPTPVALKIAAGVFTSAALVLVMSAVAGLDIWITGRQGASRVVVGATLALALLAVPLWLYVASRQYPEINDVTTDLVQPPDYVELAEQRPSGSNPIEYPRERFAALQQASYPDLKTLLIPRSAQESFEIALQALAKLRYKTAFEVPPDEDPGSPGIIELVDRTMILGFTDDVVIRVTGDDASSRIDLRSASRNGRNDFGRNAARVRELLKEIVGRLEASVPSPGGKPKVERKKDDKPATKRPRDRDPDAAADRSTRDPSRSSVRRAPARKASPQE